ncbi:MAG: extracellular solute-binding protein [Eubacterium sp.]|nr:extracellular solute-binding protein [Eubacterium sp.]
MRANKKKLLAMGLSVALAIGCLSGCGGNGGSTDTKKPEAKNDNGGSSTKKKIDDLGGINVLIGDWYTTDEVGETDYAKATEKYRKDIQTQHNFKIKRSNEYSYTDMQETYVNGVMSQSPSCQLFYLYQEMVSAPLMRGLMKDLSKLPEFDFSEEKWNPTVTEIMSIGNGIWGMSNESEPRGGVFFNKRMLKDAGIDPDEPYDLQKAGKWTWDKFEDYCKKLTVDTDGDGKTDQYALASFSKYYLPMCAANNMATFVSRNKDGKYENATGTSEFLYAMNWGMSLMDKGYIMPKPNGAAWDWYKAAFRDGEVAMQTAEVYEISAFASMDDEWGFVMFPYNQKSKDKNITNKTTPNDNIIVMPSCTKDEDAEKIAAAFDLYTEATPGYTLDDRWKETYLEQFKDTRAVDETLQMMTEQEHKQTSYLPLINDLDYGDFCYSVYAGATKPKKKIEEISAQWDSKISDMNKKYANFAATHSK